MAKEEKGLELTIPLPATEDKSMLDRIREGASSYDKKITDAINYVTPPELRPILRGLEQIAPFQNLPKYDFNKSFKENIINMATDTGILGLDLATFGIGSAPSKIGLKVADEVAKTAAKKTGVKKIDEIIEEGVKKTTRGPQRRDTIQLKIENYLKGMDKNEVVKMTEDQLVDLLEKRLNVPVSKGSIGRARRELGLTSGQAGLSGKAVIMRNALNELGEAKQSMSLEDIVKYLKENNNIDTTKDALRKILEPGSYYVKKDIAGNKVNTVRNVLLNLDSLENVTMDQLQNIPEIKKLNISDREMGSVLFRAKQTPGLEDFKIVQKTAPKGEVLMNRLASEGKINLNELNDFLEADPSVDYKRLVSEFPILKTVSQDTISKYRLARGLASRQNPVKEAKFQTMENPSLDKRLEYVRNIENLYSDNIKDKAIKIIKAHALGEGKVLGLGNKDVIALEKKIKYIPQKNLDEIKKPSFFLTYSGNIKHRDIEGNLINALVDKYQKLGYKFVDDAEMPWKEPDKKIDLSLSKNKELASEIKDLNKEIDNYKKQLKDLNAFTLFYNPVKDKMVSYGKDVSEIPGLANMVTRIKKGELELKKGGIVSMEEMINRPIYERY